MPDEKSDGDHPHPFGCVNDGPLPPGIEEIDTGNSLEFHDERLPRGRVRYPSTLRHFVNQVVDSFPRGYAVEILPRMRFGHHFTYPLSGGLLV